MFSLQVGAVFREVGVYSAVGGWYNHSFVDLINNICCSFIVLTKRGESEREEEEEEEEGRRRDGYRDKTIYVG